LKLEQELIKNKETIFRLLSNNSKSSLVIELRRIATNLILQLTSEIQREAKEQQKRGKFLFWFYSLFCLFILRKKKSIFSYYEKNEYVFLFFSF
jgi:hypothetical protein